MKNYLFTYLGFASLCLNSMLVAGQESSYEHGASVPAVDMKHESVDDLRAQASNGNALAAYEIARRYQDGELKPYDPNTFFSYAKAAADAGVDEGKLLVARAYWTGLPGICGNQEAELGKNMMKQLADEDNAEAQARYADIVLREFKDDIEKGTPIGKAKHEEGNRLLESAIKKGNPRAINIQGSMCLESGNIAEGIELMQQAAAMGDASAMHTLALYYHSIGEEEKSINLFKKASDRGHAMAMAALAMDYFKGTEFIEKDNYKAFVLMQEAAMRGYVDAQAVLGIVLLDNYESPDLRKQGVYWVRTAAENGQLEAIEYIRKHAKKFGGDCSN